MALLASSLQLILHMPTTLPSHWDKTLHKSVLTLADLTALLYTLHSPPHLPIPTLDRLYPNSNSRLPIQSTTCRRSYPKFQVSPRIRSLLSSISILATSYRNSPLRNCKQPFTSLSG